MTTSRRDHLVDTALKLFCRQGIRATGIDTVLSESGVAKKTLYNHFKSKDELVIAALQQRDRDFLDTMRAGIARLAPSQPGDSRMHRPLAFFEALGEWIEGDNFYGCTFINASAEYPRQEDPVHVACASHKNLVVQFIEELLGDMNLEDSHLVARQLALLADGAIVTAHTGGDRRSADCARQTARQLLEAYLD